MLSKQTWDRERSPRKICRDGSPRNEIGPEREIGPETGTGTVSYGRENAEREKSREKGTDEKERKRERGNENVKRTGNESSRERGIASARCGGRETSFWIQPGDGMQDWVHHNPTSGGLVLEEFLR